MVNIVICDDEIEFHEIISYKIRHCMQEILKMDFNIVCFKNLDDLKKHLDSERVDILFLDIMINDRNAMDWSIDNVDNDYVQFIFMTSYPQCAYNISETRCCYYIIKSRMNDQILERAIRRAIEHTADEDVAPYCFKVGNKRQQIKAQDIVYIESLNNNIVFHLHNQDSIRTYASLKRYESKLPPYFLRVHKSYMINLNFVTSYEPYNFVMENEVAIPVPAKKYTEAVEKYNNYMLSL